MSEIHTQLKILHQNISAHFHYFFVNIPEHKSMLHISVVKSHWGHLLKNCGSSRILCDFILLLLLYLCTSLHLFVATFWFFPCGMRNLYNKCPVDGNISPVIVYCSVEADWWFYKVKIQRTEGKWKVKCGKISSIVTNY